MSKNRNIFVYPLILMVCIFIFFGSCKKDEKTPSTFETIKDIDGNVYRIVKIGSQVWMADDLKTSKYRNGDPIPYVADNNQWGALTNGAYCYYDNNPDNGSPYGKLYNWYAAVDNRNIAPIGWHLPSDSEYVALVNYLGGKPVAGGKLKETGTTHWLSPNSGATNETGFSGLPGGFRDRAGLYLSRRYYSYWWSSTPYDSAYSWYYFFSYNLSEAGRSHDDLNPLGMYIRCIKD